jgi:hypothetical protein
MIEPKKTARRPPKFKSEDEEAKWWASTEGRQFLKAQMLRGSTRKTRGSTLVAKLGSSDRRLTDPR